MNQQFLRAKDSILKYISTNNLRSGDKLPSVRGFAKEFGVSPLTVQKALSLLISQGLLNAKVGSGTYIAAPEVKTNANRTIGVIMPPFQPGQSIFPGIILSGIEECLKENNYRALLIQRYQGDVEKEELSSINDILQQGPQGVIVNLTSPQQSLAWMKLAQIKIPVVCVNNLGPRHIFSGVTTNNVMGGRLVAETLWNKGHTDVIIAAGDLQSNSVIDRLSGFENFYRLKGIEIPEKNKFYNSVGDVSKETIKKWAEEIAAMKKRPTAIFAIHDGVAAELMLQLKISGLQIPEDISIIGFDDNEICRFTTPQLTTVRQPAFDIGKRAAEIILSQISEKGACELSEISLTPELVLRQSVTNIQ